MEPRGSTNPRAGRAEESEDSRAPCHYCHAEDGVERLGTGFSGRCGAHYWQQGFPPDVEAPDSETPDVDGPPVEQHQDEGGTISMFPLGPAQPAR